jgi:hypothetical protein
MSHSWATTIRSQHVWCGRYYNQYQLRHDYSDTQCNQRLCVLSMTSIVQGSLHIKRKHMPQIIFIPLIALLEPQLKSWQILTRHPSSLQQQVCPQNRVCFLCTCLPEDTATTLWCALVRRFVSSSPKRRKDAMTNLPSNMHQKLTNPGMRGLFVTSRSKNNKCSEMSLGYVDQR